MPQKFVPPKRSYMQLFTRCLIGSNAEIWTLGGSITQEYQFSSKPLQTKNRIANHSTYFSFTNQRTNINQILLYTLIPVKCISGMWFFCTHKVIASWCSEVTTMPTAHDDSQIITSHTSAANEIAESGQPPHSLLLQNISSLKECFLKLDPH